MILDKIQKICSDFPHVTEEIKWKSDLVYMIARKMFCVVDLEAVPMSVAFKVPNEDFDEVSSRPNYKPAPYFAQHKWVTAIDASQIPTADLKSHLQTSYDLVKAKLPKKVLQELNADDPKK